MAEERQTRSLARRFARDYLLVSIIPLLLLLAFVVGGFLYLTDYSTDVLQSAIEGLSSSAESNLQGLGEQLIQIKARAVAEQVKVYVLTHPDTSVELMQRHPIFVDMAVQLVGRTGYTFVYETETGIMRAHPESGLVGRDAEYLAENYPSLWGLFEPTLAGIEISGYYNWPEPDGTTRRRYVTMVPVGVKAQGTALMVGATAYIDEFSMPVEVMRENTRALVARQRNFILRRGGIIIIIGVFILVVTFFGINVLARRAARYYISPIEVLASAVPDLGEGKLGLSKDAPVLNRRDEIGTLAQAFVEAATRVRDLVSNLEQRVEERTRDLAQRSNQLEAAGQVAKNAAAIRDVRQLLDATVRLISERFGFYHAGIFLLDEDGEYAVLQAASSEGGQRMLAREHRLRVGEVGIVGYVTGTGQPRTALDVGEDATYFNNPDLPNTRSEMALPLKVRDHIIGALDVQSTAAAAFSDEDVAILQMLADQVALAIENARLFEETETALAEAQRTQRRYLREVWNDYAREEEAVGYMADSQGVRVAADWWTPEMRQALAEQQLVVGVEDEEMKRAALAVPLRLRGETIGVIDLSDEERERVWTDEERTIIETFSEQLAIAMENARLFDQTQSALSLSERLYEASRNIAEAQEATQIYQILVEECMWYGAADRAAVLLAAPKPVFRPEYLEVIISRSRNGIEDDDLIGTRYQAGTSVIIRALGARAEPVFFDDISADPRVEGLERQNWVERLGMKFMMAIPIVSGTNWFGLLIVQMRGEHQFDEDEIRFYRSLIDRVTATLQTRQLVQMTADRARRERLTREITDRIRASADVEGIVQTALQELREALGATYTALRLGNERTLPLSETTDGTDISVRTYASSE